MGSHYRYPFLQCDLEIFKFLCVQEESTHVFCKDTAKTFEFILKMKQIKNPFLVVGIDHGQDKVLTVVFVSELLKYTSINKLTKLLSVC